ncbi:MAG: hypothetical protein NVS1B14_01050 [Vulcanimicrobiaceae bacterium]
MENDRLIAAPTRMPGRTQVTDGYNEIGDIPKEKLDGMCRFLLEYSRREGNTVDLVGVSGVKEALKSIAIGAKKFRKARG